MIESKDIIQKFKNDLGYYAVASIIPAILGLLALSIFTRVFSTASYGRYALTVTGVSISTTIIFGWLRQSILRFDSEETNYKVNQLVILIFLLTFIFSIIACFILWNYNILSASKYYKFVFVGILLVWTQGVYTTSKVLFEARLESKLVSAYEFLFSSIKLVTAVALAIYLINDIVGWLWGGVFSGFVCTLLMWRKFKIGNKFELAGMGLLIRFFRYGFPMIGWLLGLSLLNFGDRILLEALSSSSAVGIYSSNYTIGHRGMLLVFTPLIQAAHPIIMDQWKDDNPEEILDLMTKFTRYFLVVGIPVLIGVATMSYPLSKLFLPQEHLQGYLIIPFVVSGLFFWNITMIGHKGLEVKNKTKIMLVGVFLTVLTNLALNFILIPQLGFIGAAIATLLSFLFYTIFIYIISRQYIRWKIPVTSLVNTGLAGSIMMLPCVFAYLITFSSGIMTFISTILGLGLYLITLYWLGEFKSDELSILYSHLN